MSQFSNLVHAFTTKHYGDLSWQVAKDPSKWLETTRAQAALARDLNFDPDDLISAYQKHTKKVVVIDENKLPMFPADGLVTRQRLVPLMVHSADCMPVLLYDPRKQAIGAVHAGWRGTLAGIGREAVFAMQSKFDSRPQDIVIAIGPSIGPCHFEVQNDVWLPFKRHFKNKEVFVTLGSGKYLNLWLAVSETLRQVGVLQKNIEIMGMCTYCHESEFSSYRREKSYLVTMGNVIYLK
ncbi:peptidoglycan editing factor PgeF [Candidatus Uhrbacteria bacterium]|nr:peptidoglycan editing factor PgeF [Candidatus Uhrbacteria bacterium]